MKKALIYAILFVVTATVVYASQQTESRLFVATAYAGFFVTLVFGLCHLIYFLLPSRKLQGAQSLSFFPKYHAELEGDFGPEEISAKMESFGYKKQKTEGNSVVYSHGFVTADFSVKFAQNVVKIVHEKGKMKLFIYHSVFVFFDTGDYSKILDELRQKLLQA